MLAAFCLVVLFIFCGLLLGLIEVACAKNAKKKVRLIDKRRFGKMVDEEAKKRIKNTCFGQKDNDEKTVKFTIMT